MHQNNYWNDQDNPHCSWVFWLLIDAQVVPWWTKRIIRMYKMSLDAACCLGWPQMLLDVLDVFRCTSCALMHKLCLEAPKHLCGWSRWPLMQLDLLDVYQCTSCALMHQNILCFEAVIGCIWMLKITLHAAGCLGCLWMFKMSFKAVGWLGGLRTAKIKNKCLDN